MKLLILGGTGLQAESIVLDLLEIDSENIDEITLASRRPEKLKERVEKIGSPKVRWATVDVTDHDALVALMKQHDLVFNAANTPTVFTVIKAALDAEVNLMGLEGIDQGLVAPGAPTDEFGFTKPEYFDELSEKFAAKGLTAVMGWGYVPGITNFIGRVVADQMDTIDTMVWNYATASLGDKIMFTETPKEMIWLYHQGGIKVENGEYVRIDPLKERYSVDFPDPIGKVTVQHMSFMPTVPVFKRMYADKGIQNIDVRLGYWAGYVEMMDYMGSLGLLDDQPKHVAGVDVAPVDVFLTGPGVANKEGLNLKEYGCVHLEACGTKNGNDVSYVADVMGYPIRNLGAMQIITGIPAAIGIQMFLTGRTPRNGFFTSMHKDIDPQEFFRELGRRGFTVKITTTETLIDGQK